MPPYRFTALKLYPPIFAVIDTVCVDGLLLHILRACPGSVPVAFDHDPPARRHREADSTHAKRMNGILVLGMIYLHRHGRIPCLTRIAMRVYSKPSS